MPSKTLVSTVIVLVIGLHLLPPIWRRERGTLWPFMQYAMYKNSRGPGPVEAKDRRIIAVMASGREDTVTTDLLGLSITVLEQRFLKPLAAGDTSAVPLLVERLERVAENEPVVEVRLESETFTVTDTGVVRTDNPVLRYPVTASRQQ